MSASLNSLTLIGNLGKDPEVRTTQSGDRIVSFSLAVSETWKDKASGERKERTEWIPVVIKFNTALTDVAEKYLHKGSRIYVQGEFQTRKWTDKDGRDRYSSECVVSRFGRLMMLDGKAGDGGAGAARKANERATDEALGEDAIPF